MSIVKTTTIPHSVEVILHTDGSVNIRAGGILSACKAADLIAALTPDPAPAAPVLVGTEWLTGPNPAPPARWRVEYRHYGSQAAWSASTLPCVAGRAFESAAAAREALGYSLMGAGRKLHYRVVPDA